MKKNKLNILVIDGQQYKKCVGKGKIKGCNSIKKIEEFALRSDSNTYRKQCHECQANYQQIIDTIRSSKPEYKIRKKEYDKKYKSENKKQIRTRERANYPKLKLKKNEARRKNTKQRLKIDPFFKLRKYTSTAILRLLKLSGGSKDGYSIFNFLPYSIEELKNHIESQFEPWMNWDNHGQYDYKSWNDDNSSTWTWQIDHIVPQSELVFDSLMHPNFLKCWALENLRPLSAKQNILDGANRIRHNKE